MLTAKNPLILFGTTEKSLNPVTKNNTRKQRAMLSTKNKLMLFGSTASVGLAFYFSFLLFLPFLVAIVFLSIEIRNFYRQVSRLDFHSVQGETSYQAIIQDLDA